MTLPVSGPISLSNVNVELGLSPNSQISLNTTSVRTLLGKSSGIISLSDGFGKSNRVSVNLVISANTANYNIRNSVAGSYVAGKTDVVVTINSGVYVYSTSTAAYALTVGAFAAGDTVKIINNGIIIGCGGAGGVMTNPASRPGIVGSSGGPALNADYNISITNNSIIAGGGGGGGSGASYGSGGPVSGAGGAGRGTAASLSKGTNGNNGSGGAAGGVGGTTSTGGNGTGQTALNTGGGGGGGGFASTGGKGGASGNDQVQGGNGGAGGSCLVGNSNIIWVVVGSRYGTIS